MSTLKVNDKVFVANRCRLTKLSGKVGVVTLYNTRSLVPYRVYIPGYKNTRTSSGEWYFSRDELIHIDDMVPLGGIDPHYEWDCKFDEQKAIDNLLDEQLYDILERLLDEPLYDITNEIFKFKNMSISKEQKNDKHNTNPKKKIFGVRLKKKDNETYKDIVRKHCPHCICDEFYGGVSGCPGTYMEGAPTPGTKNCFSHAFDPEASRIICADCWNSQYNNEKIRFWVYAINKEDN